MRIWQRCNVVSLKPTPISCLISMRKATGFYIFSLLSWLWQKNGRACLIQGPKGGTTVEKTFPEADFANWKCEYQLLSQPSAAVSSLLQRQLGWWFDPTEANGKAPADFNRASCWRPNLQKFCVTSMGIVDRNKTVSYWVILFLQKWAPRSSQFA